MGGVVRSNSGFRHRFKFEYRLRTIEYNNKYRSKVNLGIGWQLVSRLNYLLTRKGIRSENYEYIDDN